MGTPVSDDALLCLGRLLSAGLGGTCGSPASDAAPPAALGEFRRRSVDGLVKEHREGWREGHAAGQQDAIKIIDASGLVVYDGEFIPGSYVRETFSDKKGGDAVRGRWSDRRRGDPQPRLARQPGAAERHAATRGRPRRCDGRI